MVKDLGIVVALLVSAMLAIACAGKLNLKTPGKELNWEVEVSPAKTPTSKVHYSTGAASVFLAE